MTTAFTAEDERATARVTWVLFVFAVLAVVLMLTGFKLLAIPVQVMLLVVAFSNRQRMKQRRAAIVARKRNGK